MGIKHILPLLLMAAALLLPVCAAEVGEPTGEVLATDIRAFFCGYELPAYNVDGDLCIVCEDLSGYGFSVEWNGDDRTISLTRTGEVTEPLSVVPTDAAVGTKLCDVLYTDIRTFLDGEELESANIGGRTVIPFSALDRYGTRVYDDRVRLSMLLAANIPLSASPFELPLRIIHAGGEIGGYKGSNSPEALDASYAIGCRNFEIDFVLTSDGEPVALHDWSNIYANELRGLPLSLSEFQKLRIYGRFTPLTLDTLLFWMEEHPDTRIVTDVKDNNIAVLRKIAEKAPALLPRFLPQIYAFDEYAPVRALGFTNIILTCYRLPTYAEKADARALADFALSHGLCAVTADVSLATADYVRTFAESGVPLYVHTVNNRERYAILRAMGVQGVYTDSLR